MKAIRFHAYGGPEVLRLEEIPVRDYRCLFMGERGRFREDLFLRHDNYVRIAAEARQRKDVPADPGLVYTRTYGVHRAANFVADHARNLGRVGIQAPAREDVAKVDAAGGR